MLPEQQPNNATPPQRSVGYGSGVPPSGNQPSPPANPYSMPVTTPETPAPPTTAPLSPVVPQPAPAAQPVSTPTVSGPQAHTATVADFGQSVSQNQMIKFGKKRWRIPKRLFAVLLVSLLVISGVTAAIQLSGSIPLEKYDERLFSVLVPKDYERDTGFMTVFEEKEGAEDTRSGLVVAAEEYPQQLSAEQKTEVLDDLEEGLKENPELNGLGRLNGEMKGIAIERKKFKGHDALYFSARTEKDGRSTGKIKAVILSTEKGYYMVLVWAHEGDPKVARSMDKIINSLEIK